MFKSMPARHFARDERGNVAMLFCAAAVPLLLLMGGAVDLSRYTRYKADLANAVDSSALALARKTDQYKNECKKVGDPCPTAAVFVENYLGSFNVEDDEFAVAAVEVDRAENGFLVSASGTMKTMFLPLGDLTGSGTGLRTMAVDVATGVVQASNRVELALVFDNTGSMAFEDTGSGTRMDGLKTAATKLLDVLMPPKADETEDVKIALVPFEGSVNILNDSFKWDWIDKGQHQTWSVTTSTGSGKNKKTTTTNYDKWYGRSQYNGINMQTVKDKDDANRRPSHFWLYDLLKLDWAGCVEMRQEYLDPATKKIIPYDIMDTAPDQNKPETLYVQTFWPDEPDKTGDEKNQAHDNYTNNYLSDDTTSSSYATRQAQFSKYELKSFWRTDKTWPYSSGPNHGCPRPIVTLTPKRKTIEDAIDDMEPYGAMGTFIPTGLMWGWHVLSPTEPFTQGVGKSDDKYVKTVKAIVLLSDGENSATLTSDTDNHNKSLYSAYNYYLRGRLGTVADNTSTNGPNAKLNSKTASLCANVKADGIRLYTITFGSIPAAAKTLMSNCASQDKGQALYYHAPTDSTLDDIFKAIGNDLSNLHLSS